MSKKELPVQRSTHTGLANGMETEAITVPCSRIAAWIAVYHAVDTQQEWLSSTAQLDPLLVKDTVDVALHRMYAANEPDMDMYRSVISGKSHYANEALETWAYFAHRPIVQPEHASVMSAALQRIAESDADEARRVEAAHVLSSSFLLLETVEFAQNEH